jgi:hypothetical protein
MDIASPSPSNDDSNSPTDGWGYSGNIREWTWSESTHDSSLKKTMERFDTLEEKVSLKMDHLSQRMDFLFDWIRDSSDGSSDLEDIDFNPPFHVLERFRLVQHRANQEEAFKIIKHVSGLVNMEFNSRLVNVSMGLLAPIHHILTLACGLIDQIEKGQAALIGPVGPWLDCFPVLTEENTIRLTEHPNTPQTSEEVID